MKDSILVLQPKVPHYRETFFEKVKEMCPGLDVVLFADGENSGCAGWKTIRSFSFGSFLIFNPFVVCGYRTVVLCGDMHIISNWIILLLAKVLGCKTLLWGQGVDRQKASDVRLSLKEYCRTMFYRLASGAIFYTEKELELMRARLPRLQCTFVNNTIDVHHVIESQMNYNSEHEAELKGYSKDKITIIHCARFTHANRRYDLLVRLIESLDPDRFKFLMIGDGPLKPDFSKYENVEEFGSVYAEGAKQKIFARADFNWHPAWTGLSVVESFARSVPFLTMKKGEGIKQGVEYNYIKDGYNGKTFDRLEDCINYLKSVDSETISILKRNAVQCASTELSLSHMVEKFVFAVR